jgi:hypothetical protein
MDCRTARLLLEYARPASAELDAAETQALDEHLASCEGCEQQARAERRADEAVGKAMRQVDVPDQLRQRVTARLKEGQKDVLRRRIAVGLFSAAAAAAVLLLMLGAWRWFFPRPAFPTDQLVLDANKWVISTPDSALVEAKLKDRGVRMDAPTDLNYSHLRWLFLTNIEGRQTPLLVFNNAGEGGQGSQHALVFLLTDNQFDLTDLHNPQLKNAYEYKCVTRVAVNDRTGERTGYVIYYTGDNLDWLTPPPGIPAVGVGN